MNIDIGGISVKLLLDKKPLEQGSKAAEGALRDLERKNQEIASRINTVAARAAAGLAAAFAAAGYAVKKSLDQMNEIERLSQALGMTTEELSRLEYAAERSGVPMEKLRAAVVTLSKGLTDVAAGGSGDAAMALEALGIKATDAAGRMKSSREVVGEVADRFAGLRDGVNKTRLAVALFGEAGAELVPTLNKGAMGLAEIEAEADRLGVTIDKKTAEDAKKLKNTIGELVAVGEGYVNHLTARMVPGLQAVADEFLEVAKGGKTATDVVGDFFSRVAQQWNEGVERARVRRDLASRGIFATDEAVDAELARIARVRGEFDDLRAHLKSPVEKTEAPEGTKSFGTMSVGVELVNLDAFKRAREEAKRIAEETRAEEEARSQRAIELAEAEAEAVIEAAKAESLARIEGMIAEGEAITQSLESPIEAMERARQKYAELAQAGVISADVQEKANLRAAASMASAYVGAASQISGALSQLFGESKGFALANAVINTAEGITKAMAIYGPTPLGFAAAAAAAASGAAQIAAIRSAQKGGGGAAQSQAASRPVASAQGGGGQAGSSQTLYVKGINPNQMFTGDALRDFADQILQFQRDGGRVVLA